ncbi:hypothetical protein LP7551_04527 [Roseibium album]|nr:hypothetical protein LP7551_04527 [Roseibium album]
MTTNKKLLSSLIAAVFVSGAFVGNAFALDPDDSVGDLTGDKPLSIRQMKIANEKALRAARNGRLLTLKPQSEASRAAYADFPDQSVGDLNGNNPVPVRQQVRDNSIADRQDLLILQFQGDWNGTAKKGFPHQ